MKRLTKTVSVLLIMVFLMELVPLRAEASAPDVIQSHLETIMNTEPF